MSRTTAIVVTLAIPDSIDVDKLSKEAKALVRFGVVVSTWQAVTDENRRSFLMMPPAEARCAIVDTASAMHFVRETFDDVSALLGAAEGEPR